MRGLGEKIKKYWLSDVSFVTQLLFLAFMVFIVPMLVEFGLYIPILIHSIFLLFLISGIFYEYKNKLLWFAMLLFVLQVLLFIRYIWSPHDTNFLFHWITIANVSFFIYLNVRLLFRDKAINFYRIVGAINIYLLIAIYGALCIGYIDVLMNASITGAVDLQHNEFDYGQFMYFSLSSLTTVGYGDIYAASMTVKMLGVFLSSVGILFPAVVLARLVSLFDRGELK